MQTTGLRRFRRAILAMSLGVAALSATPAHALYPCEFEGSGTGFQLQRLDLPNGANSVGIIPDSHFEPRTYSTRENHVAQGLMVFTQSGALVLYYLDGITGQRPRIVVQNGNQRVIDQELVGTPVGGLGWSSGVIPGGIAAGTYYAIGFGFGTTHYKIALNVTGTCTPISPTGVTGPFLYDQTDFQAAGANLMFGGQVDLIAAGSGSNLSLSLTTSRRYFVGYLHVGTSYNTIGYHGPQLDYSFPSGQQGRLQDGKTVAVVSGPGQFNFKLKYGPQVLQHVSIDGWAIDI